MSLKSSFISLFRNKAFRLLFVGVCAYFIGVLSTESQVEIQERIVVDKVRESELLRQIEETKRKMEDVKRDVVTEETVVLPDGTRKVVKTIDKSKIVSEELSELSDKLESKEKEVERLEKELSVKPGKKNYSLGVGTDFEISNNPLELMTYEAVVGRRIVFDLWLKGRYNWQKSSLGLGVEWQF